MATVEGAKHVVRYLNPAFSELISKASGEFIGRPFDELFPDETGCLTLLDRVYRTGKFASYNARERSGPSDLFSSFTMWPVTAHGRTVGVMIQVIETAPLLEMTLAMNEALMLGSLRQHELTAAADSSNIQLKTEIDERKQRERDALLLTYEVSHRVKNNLQIVIALIASEARRTAPPCVQGYIAMQTRIGAIAKLYDLISQSTHGRSVTVDAYLTEIAGTMSASLLETTSSINIEVKAETLEIDPDRAVPFGLLVNELGTNAIKHAFPGGAGRITLGVVQVGDQIELTVADNGVGMKDEDSALVTGKHGTDYVATFVRQLGATMTVSGAEELGTIVRIRLPLHVIPAKQS
jgi:two-component sensor histidine kinase